MWNAHGRLDCQRPSGQRPCSLDLNSPSISITCTQILSDSVYLELVLLSSPPSAKLVRPTSGPLNHLVGSTMYSSALARSPQDSVPLAPSTSAPVTLYIRQKFLDSMEISIMCHEDVLITELEGPL